MDGNTPDRSARLTRSWPTLSGKVAGRLRWAKRHWQVYRIQRRLAGPKILAAFARCHPDAFFIEIGANDGDQHDHLRPFVVAGNWRGIMVEPVPYVFERLRARYGDVPRVALENLAVADRDGVLPFYHLKPVDSGSPRSLSWSDGLGSFSREAILSHDTLVPDLEQRLTCVEIPCLTLESLCRKHAVEQIDLLVIDTEGYDHEILKSIDWRRRRPRLVVYEHYHMQPEQRQQLRDRLSEVGYELKEEGFDTWCLLATDDNLTRTFRALAPAIPASSALIDRDRRGG